MALEECVDVLAKNGIKVAINGGSQNPAGLAKKVNALVRFPSQSKYICMRVSADLDPSP